MKKLKKCIISDYVAIRQLSLVSNKLKLVNDTSEDSKIRLSNKPLRLDKLYVQPCT